MNTKVKPNSTETMTVTIKRLVAMIGKAEGKEERKRQG